MANETRSTDIAELAAIAIQEAILAAQSYQMLWKLLKNRSLNAGEKSVSFPRYGNQLAAAITEGSEITPSRVSTTEITLTPDVNAAWGTVLTKKAMRNAPQAMADIGRLAAEAITKKKNQDVFALFDGFSTSIGSSGQDITRQLVQTGMKKLQQSTATGRPKLVITPEVNEDLMNDLASTSGGNSMVSDNMRDAINNGALDVRIPILGCDVILVTSGISEVGDVKCGLFTEDALAYVSEWDFDTDLLYRPFKIGTEVAMTSSYAVGEIRDEFGVELLVDGAD